MVKVVGGRGVGAGRQAQVYQLSMFALTGFHSLSCN